MQFEGVCSELAHLSEAVQLAADVLDCLEVVILLQRYSEWYVVLHFSEVLDGSWIGVMINEFPLVPGALEGPEAGRFQVHVCRFNNGFVDTVFAYIPISLLFSFISKMWEMGRASGNQFVGPYTRPRADEQYPVREFSTKMRAILP